MSYPYLSDFINHLFGTQWEIPIAMFGSFVAIAIVAATLIAKREVIRLEGLGLISKAKVAPNIYVPSHKVLSDLAVVSSLSGIVGARIFHILEYPAEFLATPLEMLFSVSGLSIYGGLLFGCIAGFFFLKKRAIPIPPMLDALAPALILGYGIGRIGCQISGDGDWGVAADMALKPDFLPVWFWAQTYENNIVGAVIQNPGVYPTPVYEALSAFLIFSILWAIRKTEFSRGFVFSVYLLLSGFARLLIEKIRINSEYHIFGASFTQAELISVLIILVGIVGVLKTTPLRLTPKIAFSGLVLCVLTACQSL